MAKPDEYSLSMSSSPLSIAFLWHMHQPYYKDPFSGIYRLPGADSMGPRTTSTWPYSLTNIPISDRHSISCRHSSSNYRYTENSAKDTFLEVTLKRPSDLSDEERAFILGKLLPANWDTMIRPFPRYYELLLKRDSPFQRATSSHHKIFFRQ